MNSAILQYFRYAMQSKCSGKHWHQQCVNYRRIGLTFPSVDESLKPALLITVPCSEYICHWRQMNEGFYWLVALLLKRLLIFDEVSMWLKQMLCFKRMLVWSVLTSVKRCIICLVFDDSNTLNGRLTDYFVVDCLVTMIEIICLVILTKGWRYQLRKDCEKC